jgi:hypothetical protein
MIENEEILGASLNGRFIDALQGLLLYPGFDELVMSVTAKVAQLLSDRKGPRRYMDPDLVHITVALQRNDGELRRRAMDVYELLLDSGVYGAEEAAKAALGR